MKDGNGRGANARKAKKAEGGDAIPVKREELAVLITEAVRQYHREAHRSLGAAPWPRRGGRRLPDRPRHGSGPAGTRS